MYTYIVMCDKTPTLGFTGCVSAVFNTAAQALNNAKAMNDHSSKMEKRLYYWVIYMVTNTSLGNTVTTIFNEESS